MLAQDVMSQVKFTGTCPQTTTVQDFNVQKYLGRWFEIKSYPTVFQTGGKCVEANYGLNLDGSVSVLNKQTVDGKQITIEGSATQSEVGQGKLIVKFPQVPSRF